jgi:hypothetical protein
MRTFVASLLLMASSPSLAITPESSRAVLLAVGSGEIVGAAIACGLTPLEQTVIRRQTSREIRSLSESEQEHARARSWYDRAIERAAAKAGQDGVKACPEVIGRARALIGAR